MSAGFESGGAELEFYLETDLYDSTFRDRREDIEFFVSEALRSGGPVLEFGAGSGRVTIPLARAGLRVTAVDLSSAMLARLESRLLEEAPEVRARVVPVLADMRNVRLGERFPLVLGTFNVIGHLRTREDLMAFLDAAEAHLAPGGRILFDSMVPSPDELDAEPEDAFECDPLADPLTSELVTPVERFSYNPETRLLTVQTTYESEGRSREGPPLILRQWFPRELEELLGARAYAELEITADYSDDRDLEDADMLMVRISLA